MKFRPLNSWPFESTNIWTRRGPHTFSASWSNTLGLLDKELDTLSAQNIVIQAQFTEDDIRLDGMPRSAARTPSHPGIIVSFESKHGPLQYATDTHEFWQHNVRAIALGLQALRAVDRYGITKTGEQYTGWRQLTAGSGITSWEQASALIADLAGIDTFGGVIPRSVYNNALKKAHPDGGGNSDLFAAVRDAGRLLGVAS